VVTAVGQRFLKPLIYPTLRQVRKALKLAFSTII
jgi:hypothetical protein